MSTIGTKAALSHVVTFATLLSLIEGDDLIPGAPAPTQGREPATTNIASAQRQRSAKLAALRTLVKIVGRCTRAGPLQASAIPCDVAWLNERLFRLPPKAHGLEPRSFGNYITALRQILRDLDLLDPEFRVALSEDSPWRPMLESLKDARCRYGLTKFATWCDAADVAPTAVTDETLAAFEQHVRTRHLRDDIAGFIGGVVKSWRKAASISASWPSSRIAAPPRKQRYRFTISDFPVALQEQVASFRRRLSGEGSRGPFRNEGPPKSLRPRSVETRVYGLKLALNAYVETQRINPSQVTDLAMLLVPEAFRDILTFHWERAVQRRMAAGELDPDADPADDAGNTTQTASVASALMILAKHVCRVPDDELDVLRDLAAKIRPESQNMISRRNVAILDRLLEPRNRFALMRLPVTLMKEADAMTGQPLRAALKAMAAVAIEIELNKPLRLMNLTRLRLGEELQFTDPHCQRPTRLKIRSEDVKNAVDRVADLQAAGQSHRPLYLPSPRQSRTSRHPLALPRAALVRWPTALGHDPQKHPERHRRAHRRSRPPSHFPRLHGVSPAREDLRRPRRRPAVARPYDARNLPEVLCLPKTRRGRKQSRPAARARPGRPVPRTAAKGRRAWRAETAPMSPRFFRTDRLLPPIEQWPEGDRSAFQRAIGTGRGPFQRPRLVRNPYSLRMIRSGYARYLRYLDDIGDLEPQEPPCDRVSLERLDGYFQHLQQRGNADMTVLGRFVELRNALWLMYPMRDFRWVTRPQGVSLQQILRKRSRIVVPIDSAVLLAWAEELFAEGLVASTRRKRCIMVRDAVIIGLLAERAPRLRALSMLQLGDSLKRNETVWLLREHAEMMKMKAPHYMPVSARVSRMLDRYVEVERQELLSDKTPTSAAWARFGGELKAGAIVVAVRKRFLQRFGRSQGPHFFRHCLATTVADRLPSHPLDGATMLAHESPATTIASYNHATKVACARRLEALLDELRPGFEPRSLGVCSSGTGSSIRLADSPPSDAVHPRLDTRSRVAPPGRTARSFV